MKQYSKPSCQDALKEEFYCRLQSSGVTITCEGTACGGDQVRALGSWCAGEGGGSGEYQVKVAFLMEEASCPSQVSCMIPEVTISVVGSGSSTFDCQSSEVADMVSCVDGCVVELVCTYVGSDCEPAVAEVSISAPLSCEGGQETTCYSFGG